MAMESLQAIIFYSSTGEEEEVSLAEMVDRKELAWPPGESLTNPGGGGGSSKSKAAAPKVGCACKRACVRACGCIGL